jgi:hypothetical protein
MAYSIQGDLKRVWEREYLRMCAEDVPACRETAGEISTHASSSSHPPGLLTSQTQPEVEGQGAHGCCLIGPLDTK